ncbi:GCN5-related N-acetyltransferase [Kribbella flavida DSM 17836]|uniref:GCN5-related N-acetyltransferase n=1 Tax=Kribbella flavida (strain DSM 17836 / JCM 10339 / NBRC 14399) TaxID=479435 RepID=D2Q2C3_KRIFD|nr:GNAT family N-acetyltransferase [Kribbella flavida]ADB35819.1 GCN5-related N-acetyltransferase [Kribbella flavida DSM 17836]
MPVRRLTPADWSDLWPLVQGFGTDQTESDAGDIYAELLADQRWLILGYAEPGGRLIGYAAAQNYGPHLRAGRRNQGRLHDLYVHPTKRSTGVGRALVAAVVEWAEGQVRWLEWQAHEDRAAPFYERLGYRGVRCPQPEYPTFEIDFGA